MMDRWMPELAVLSGLTVSLTGYLLSKYYGGLGGPVLLIFGQFVAVAGGYARYRAGYRTFRAAREVANGE